MEESTKIVENNNNPVKMSAAKMIAFLGIYIALVIVVQSLSTVIGKLFSVVAPTLAFVPILLAIITLGVWQGVVLGAVFSTVVLIFGLTGVDGFTSFVIQDQPALTIILIYLKGCLAPLVAGLVYKVLKDKMPKGSIWIASFLLPIVNTGIFCIGMLLFYKGTLSKIPDFNGLNMVYIVFISLAGVNFLVEFFANVILTPVVTDVKKIFDRGAY